AVNTPVSSPLDPCPVGTAGEALRKQLAELKILDRRDWDKAAQIYGDDVEAIFNFLENHTTLTGSTSGCKIPKLTAYMIRRIRTGRLQELRFKHFVLMRQLGEGGMGAVYQVRNLNGNIVQALKMIHPEHIANDRIKARFVREAETMARLNHPGVPRWYEANFEGPEPYIALEFVNGRTLTELLLDRMEHRQPNCREPLMPWRDALRLIVQAADALAYAHKQGIIHRDVKPSNMMVTLDEEGREEMKVLDLGIAKLRLSEGGGSELNVGAALTSEGGSRLGTPAFMPPEQWIDAANVTPAADIYSLGVTFHYMLTGENPYHPNDGNNVAEWMREHLRAPAMPVRRVVAGVPPFLEKIVLKMLAKEPRDRYPDAGALRDALQTALRQYDTRVAAGKRWRLWMGATIAAAVVGTAAGVAGLGRMLPQTPAAVPPTAQPAATPIPADAAP
ncbi:MAG: serine/threonine-protein kinase, partial [Planctomycetia bacterium]